MTQPEETTAALIARLHEQLTIKELQLENVRKSEAVHVDFAHKAYQERDRAKADIEASKAECLQWRKDIDIERAEVARLTAQRDYQHELAKSLSRQVDEQRARAEKAEAELAQHQSNYGQAWRQSMTLAAKLEAAEKTLAERTRERDEARAESLQAGLVGREMAENLDAVTTECLKAQDLAQRHSADCDRALRERDDAREQLAKLEWAGKPRAGQQHANYSASFLGKTCPSCHQVEPSDNARENFTADQIGHRPTCWFAKKEAGKEEAKPPTLREQWKTKQAHYDHWLDAIGYTLLGVDWSGGDSVTVKTNRPIRPGASFVYESSSGIWKLVDTPPGPGRCSLCLQPDVTGKPHPYARCKDHDSSVKEPARPEPRFRVGEWVSLDDKPAEVLDVRWTTNLEQWSYVLQQREKINLLRPESHLTAQTPQHKHDRKGCVFLGRMGKWDLWFSTNGSNFVPGPTVFANGGSDPLSEYCEWSAQEPTSPRYRRDVCSSMDQTMEEARRRAVARGLVK